MSGVFAGERVLFLPVGVRVIHELPGSDLGDAVLPLLGDGLFLFESSGASGGEHNGAGAVKLHLVTQDLPRVVERLQSVDDVLGQVFIVG